MSKCLVNTFISGTKADIQGASVLNSNRSQTLLSEGLHNGTFKIAHIAGEVFQLIMAFKGLYYFLGVYTSPRKP